MRVFSSVLFAALVIKAHCDIYLHNPRGSNNRLDEANRDRANGNRMFDSQNNNRGGSNVGQLYYYEGSTLRLEWTNQHSCGGPNANCELIFQYMCDDKLRDGTTTNTIPDHPIHCYNWDCDTDVRYGRHESFASYKNCENRARNKGLFTADQKLNGDKAKYTRQNPNGARRGYECPEERDYYPYWGPTDWIDIAILTNQPERCDAYKNASANTQPRYYCDLPYDFGGTIPITQEECGSMEYTEPAPVDDPDATMPIMYGAWTMVEPFKNQYADESGNTFLTEPACHQTTFSRDNHLGNVDGGQTAFYDWVIPKHIHEQCVLRVRYNISTGDMTHFDNFTSVEHASLTAEYNGVDGGGHHDRASHSTYPIAEQYLEMALDVETNEPVLKTPAEAYMREYYLANNPKVDPFGSWITDTDYTDPDSTPKVQFQLAINTAQYGRTFQDRSHKFAIRSRPSSLEGVVIQNLNVRGKRGNIVQTYPGTEYDFVPNELKVKKDDYVHIQWTGSNTNPNNNAGQGKQGTDRHNALLVRERVYWEEGQLEVESDLKHGQLGSSYPKVIEAEDFMGFSKTDMTHLAILDTPGGQFGGELSELDDAGTYFDLGARKCTQNGLYNYMCTRNNNFSNRSEKAKVTISESGTSTLLFDTQQQTLVDGGSWIAAGKNDLMQAQTINMVTFPEQTETKFEGEPASSYIWVESENAEANAFPLAEGQTLTVGVEYEDSPLSYATMYRAENMEANFVEIEDAEFENGVATAEVKDGGVFVVETTPAYVAIVLVSVVVLGFLSVVGWFVFKKFRPSDLGNASARNGV